MPLSKAFALLAAHYFLFLDTSFLAYQVSQIKQTRTTHFAALEHLYIHYGRGGKRKDALHAHAIGHLANRERARGALAFDLDHITAKGLNALLVAFDNLVIDYYVIAGEELWEVALRLHLLVYELDGVHCFSNFLVTLFAKWRKGSTLG